MKKLIFNTFFLTVLILFSTNLVNAQIVEESTSWNGNSISTVGALQSDFYAQSFRANHLTRITKFGVLIAETFPQGEVILAIAADNGSGKPNVTVPLYQGALINPGPALVWFYEEGISVPVTMGQKYWILIDGYNNAGATGQSRVGSSSTHTATGENMIYTNDHGTTWGQVGNAIAVYIEGTAPPIANAVSATVAYDSSNNLIALNITAGPPTSVTVASGANHGTAIASGTSITYTPTPGYFGPDSFTYTATNAEGTSAPATVTITVNPQVPVANAVFVTVAYDSVANVIPLNITGEMLTSVAVVSAASHGTATASGTSITYTPASGYIGPDGFAYSATNAGGTSGPATVTITVNPQVPVANPVSVTVDYGSVANVITLSITGGTPTSVAIFWRGKPRHGHGNRHQYHLYARCGLLRP